jgi:hypothetical protein
LDFVDNPQDGRDSARLLATGRVADIAVGDDAEPPLSDDTIKQMLEEVDELSD